MFQPPDLLVRSDGRLSASQRDIKKLYDICFCGFGEVDARVSHGIYMQCPKFARCGSGYGIIAIQSICISIPVESVVRSVFKAHSSSRCIRQIYPTALVRIVEFVIYGIEKRNVDPVIGQDMTAILSGSQPGSGGRYSGRYYNGGIELMLHAGTQRSGLNVDAAHRVTDHADSAGIHIRQGTQILQRRIGAAALCCRHGGIGFTG